MKVVVWLSFSFRVQKYATQDSLPVFGFMRGLGKRFPGQFATESKVLFVAFPFMTRILAYKLRLRGRRCRGRKEDVVQTGQGWGGLSFQVRSL